MGDETIYRYSEIKTLKIYDVEIELIQITEKNMKIRSAVYFFAVYFKIQKTTVWQVCKQSLSLASFVKFVKAFRNSIHRNNLISTLILKLAENLHFIFKRLRKKSNTINFNPGLLFKHMTITSIRQILF